MWSRNFVESQKFSMQKFARNPNNQKDMSSKPTFKIIVSITITIALYIFFFLNDNSIIRYDKKDGRKIAVLYARPTFHEEVVSSTACIMHELGYKVVIYIGNGFHMGKIMVPFTGKRETESNRFYGHCVDQFVTISPSLPMVENPSIVVFITYPMLTKGFKIDASAVAILEYVKENHYHSVPVVMIAHHAKTFLQDVDFVAKYLHKNQTTYMFLGEHTMKHAQSVMSKAGHGKHNLDHFYPVMPFKHITGHKEASKLVQYHSLKAEDTMFSIQGSFGGQKSGWRKDPSAVINCLRDIEQGRPVSAENNLENLKRDVSMSAQSNAKPVTGDPRNNTSTMETTGRGLLRKRHSSSTLSLHHEKRLNIDLIGHQEGPLDVAELQYGRIRILSGLDSVNYYTAIAHSRFMVTAIRDPRYRTDAATSSVPAALMAEIPIVVTRSFLDLYPCLRDAPMHKRINENENECDSIAVAASLSESEYRTAKDEARECREVMWNDAKETFERIVRR